MRDLKPFQFATIRLVTWEENNAESERWWAEHPLPQRTLEEEQREREYWATKTIAERVIAGWELAEREDAKDKLKLTGKLASLAKAGKKR